MFERIHVWAGDFEGIRRAQRDRVGWKKGGWGKGWFIRTISFESNRLWNSMHTRTPTSDSHLLLLSSFVDMRELRHWTYSLLTLSLSRAAISVGWRPEISQRFSVSSRTTCRTLSTTSTGPRGPIFRKRIILVKRWRNCMTWRRRSSLIEIEHQEEFVHLCFFKLYLHRPVFTRSRINTNPNNTEANACSTPVFLL